MSGRQRNLIVFAIIALFCIAVFALSAGAAPIRHEIVFIDPAVDDARLLEGGVRSGVEVVRLDAGRDGVEQIGEALAGRLDLKAIHVISHGAPGKVFLGTGVLSAENMGDYAAQLKMIERSLRQGGELLLYGCNIAQDAAGSRFVQTLASLTGANVAASTNATGSKNLGGDWVLESRTGEISEPSVIEEGFGYQSVLAVAKVFNVSNPGEGNVYVRPGGTSYNWTYGTGWLPPNSGDTAPVTQVSYHEVNHLPAGATPGVEDLVLTIGKFQYSTDGGNNWVDYVESPFVPNLNTFNTNFMAVAGKIWRFVHNNASLTSTSEQIGFAYYVSGYGSSIGGSAYIYPDNAPTDIVSSNTSATIFSDTAQGTLVATLTPTDTGLTTGGYWAIDSQSVANLFTLSFNSATGNTATLNIGSGTLSAGQVTVTVRYYDLYQTDASGNPIGGQGFSKTLTFDVVSSQSQDLPSFGNDLKISTYTPNSQSYPSVTTLSNGNFVTVWQSAGQGGEVSSYSGIYGQIHTASGVAVDSEFAVTAAGNSVDELNPVVSALNDGRFVVAYTTNSATTGLDIAYRIVEANGSLGAELTANTVTANDQYYPAIATLSDGSFIITWTTITDPVNWDSEIHYQKFNASDGSKNGAEQAVAAATVYNDNSSVSALTGGEYVITWLDWDTSNISGIVSTAPATVFAVTSDGTSYASRSAGLNGGGFVVAWESGSGQSDIFFRRYDNAGTAQGVITRANNSTAANVYRTGTSLAALTGGGFVVGWTSPVGDYDSNGIFGRRFTSAGAAVDATDFEINQYRRGDQNTSAITGLASDLFAAVWADNSSDGTNNAGIEGRVLLTANAAPVLDTNAGLTLSQSAGQTTIGNTLLKLTDSDNPASSSLVFTLTAVPAKGSLKNGSTSLIVGNTFTQSDIDNSNISYTPSGTQTGSDGFSFTYSDGIASAQGPATFSITITDSVAPTVTSIVRSNPAGAVTNADSLVFQVTFSEAVNNLSTGDFAVSGTTATVNSVNTVVGNTYNVTIAGGDLAGLNGTVTLGFSGTQNITDTAGNPLTNTTPTGTNDNSYTVDNTAPTVAIGAPSPTVINSALTSDFGITYSGASSINLTAAQVTLAQTGSASCTKSVLNGTTATPMVRLSSCSGDGAVTITLASAAVDAAGNADAGAGPGASVAVDNSVPTVTSVTVPGNATYIAGQNLDFTVSFSENVNVAGTDSTLGLTIGSASVNAAYFSKTANSITYRYTVQNNDNDSDGITIGAITLNTTTIADAATNSANLTLNAVGSTAAVLVDALAPTVTSVTVPGNATYVAGQNLDFTVNLTENVTVTGTVSTLGLTIGVTARTAAQLSTTGNSITYRYTIQSGDIDNDGITVGSITLNTTTIRDAAANNANTTLNSVGSTASVLVDAVVPTISSVTVPGNATYIAGQNLDFTVNFTENVTVNTAGGTPYIPVTLDTGGTVNAAYVSGSGSSAIVFRYTIATGNLDTNGIAVGSAITANGGTIKDAASNDATLTLNSVGSTTAVLVDAVVPTVTSVTVPGNATYVAGQNLDFTVNLTENVTVTGADSTLGLTIGSASVSAAYFSKTANSITYRYTVQNNDNDSDGITIGAITLNTTTIADAATNNANLTLNSVGATTAVLVDALAPTVTSVTVPGNATYVAGQNLDFTVNLTENVTVTGADSTLGLTIGVTARTAAQLSTTGNSITYRYTIQSGDIDNDGITVGTLTLNTTTIRDAAANNATLTLNSVGSTAAVLVDTLVPVATAAGSVTTTGFNANWGSVTGASGYYLDVSTDSGFGSFIAGYNNLDAGNVTTYAVSGLTASSTYYYRVRAYNSGGVSANSNSITLLPRFTVTPSAGAHGSIDPATAQPVLENGSATFTLTPDTGYHLDTISGSCGGTLTGNSYTTSAITADCSVIASFAINTYTITTNASGNGAITCATPIDHGAASACNISIDPGYRLTALTSNGSDILSSVTLDQLTITNITEALTVTATFSPASHGGQAITGNDTGPHATVHAADGTQHLVYERNGTLYYRNSSGISGNWSSEETVTTGQSPAIALGSDGVPRIACLTGGQLLTTARTGGSWSTPEDTGISGANTIEIALDGNGKTHLAYTKTGSDGYDDIHYTNNISGAYAAPATICDGAYSGGNWTFCRTPQIQADNDGNYHIAYNKQQINSALSAHDPQWMIYTTNANGGSTISSHDLNPGAGTGTPQLLVRGSFGHDPLHGYTLTYGNDMEAAGLWLAEDLQNGNWTETAAAIPGNAPSQGNNDTAQTRHLAYLAPDGRIMHTARTASGYSALTELAPGGSQATVNPIKRSILYRLETNGTQQLFQVGIDALALLTPLDGNLGTTVPGQTVEKQYTLTNNGSQPLTPSEIKTGLPGYTFEIGTDNCSGITIAPGGTCTFTVRNSHQTYPVVVTDTLTITSDDPLRGTITLPLSLQVLEYHYPLAITMNGSGTVTATAAAISDFSCTSGTCSRDYDTNSIVTLTAQTPVGYTFTGFTFTGDGSACCRETSCSFTITGNTDITATFVRNSYPISTLTVSNGTLICTTPVSHGDQGICTVTPDPGYRIEGIGGSCGGTLNGNSYTTLPVTAGCTVGAVFAAAPQRSVTVTTTGTGAGTVYSAPAGIICPLGACTAQFDDSTVTTLSAVPDTNSTFGGWSGACSNTAGPCDLTMTEDREVTATFTAAPNAKVSSTGHATLTQAYAGTSNGATIKARAITFIENLVLNGNHRVTLEGGYNAEYDCNSCGGNTILKGAMTIEHGSVIMENITIR